MGQLGHDVRVVGRRRQRGDDGEVHPRLLPRGQVGEHALADEVVREAQVDAAGGLVEHAVVDRGTQNVEHPVDPGDRRQQRRVDVAPEHRGGPEQRPARLGEPADTGADDVAHRHGHPQRGRARARASSPTKNGLPPDRRATAATTSGSGPPAEPIGERGADSGVVPTGELDHQPVRHPFDLRGPDGDDDQQPRVRHLAGHVREQRQ